METIEELLGRLTGQDNAEGYRALQRLEEISARSGCLGPQIGRFAAMTADPRYVVRVRGARLFCAQARWDQSDRFEEKLGAVLGLLQDPRPTAVRQTLAALTLVWRYRPDLRRTIAEAAARIDTGRYPESMQGLLKKDVAALTATADA